MKKIKVFLLILISIFSFSFYYNNTYAGFFDKVKDKLDIKVNNWKNSNSDNSIKNKLIWSIDNNLPLDKWNTKLESFFKFLKNQIYNIVFILSIFMIVWIWVRMAIARGNPDEFKKAWMHLIYIIVWIFIVFAAWWIVNLFANLNIFN